MAASSRLAYRPSHLAQAMVTGRSRTIGLIVPDIANPFFPEVARGAEDAATDRGYSVFLADTELDHREEQRYVDLFEDKGVDGMVYLAGTPMLGPALARVAASDTPLVLVDEELAVAGPACGFVGVDNFDGGRQAARHLLDAGHRRFAVIAGPDSLPTAAARLAGCLDELGRAGIPDPPVHAARSYVFEEGLRSFSALQAAGVQATALVCANDLLALGAITHARETGLRVPADLSVVGFDDIFFSRLANPSLTTITQPMRAIGGEAARLLIDLIEGRPCERRRILPVRLTLRASTSPQGGAP